MDERLPTILSVCKNKKRYHFNPFKKNQNDRGSSVHLRATPGWLRSAKVASNIGNTQRMQLYSCTAWKESARRAGGRAAGLPTCHAESERICRRKAVAISTSTTCRDTRTAHGGLESKSVVMPVGQLAHIELKRQS